MLEEQNRVIIRVWSPIGLSQAKEMVRSQVPKEATQSQTNLFVKEHTSDYGSCGHVSIETTNPRGYYSLWPEGGFDMKKDKAGFFKPKKHEQKTYLEDLEAEGRNPDVAICLYSLDGYALSVNFERLIKNLDGWRLVGSNCVTRLSKKSSESCASLAYRLLDGGGLSKVVSSCVSTHVSSVATPNDLVKIAKEAKQYKLTKYTETKKFKFRHETPVFVTKHKEDTQHWWSGITSAFSKR
jgi:hypothetical protein